jgi:hypothetical protein
MMIARAKEMRAIDTIETPQVVDLEISRIRARAFCADLDIPSPIIDWSITEFTARGSKSSYAGHQYTDLAVWARKSELLLCTPKPALQLQDVESTGVPGQAVARMVFEGMEVGLDTRSRHTINTVRLNAFSTGIVTPAFASVRDITQAWQEACTSLPSPSIQAKPAAFVITHAVRAAIAAGQTTTQPFYATWKQYALQNTDPRNVRRDDGWSLLARLRYWTQTLPSPPFEHIPDMASYAITELGTILGREQRRIQGQEQQSAEYEELEEIESTEDDKIKEEQRIVDATEYIKKLPYIVAAFEYQPHAETSAHTTLLDHTTHIFATIALFHLEHQGKKLESDEIVSSSLNIVSASTGLQYLLGHKRFQFTKRLRVINTVKAIDVIVQNSIFTAIEPLLSLIPEPAPPDHADGIDYSLQNVIIMDNQIERAELQVVAAGLRMKGVLARGSMNAYRESGAGLMDGQAQVASRTTATMMISSMETVLSVIKERIHSASIMPTGIVATWETQDLGGMASLTSFEDIGLPDQLKLLVSLRRFDLDIRPQMKALHGLVNHVRQEDLP